MGFSSQEYWCGLPFPLPGDLPEPGIEPESPALQADSTILTELKFGSDGKESAYSPGDLGWEDPLQKRMAPQSSILA